MQVGKNPEPRKKYRKIKSFHYEFEECIYLPQIHKIKPIDFFEVLNKRKSERIFKKIFLHQLSGLLWYAAKAKKIFLSEYGTILSHRAAPSAGAIHPIDIFISLPETIENRKLYYYDPYTHKLGKLVFKTRSLHSFFKNINDCLVADQATIIWFAAHLARTSVKYKNSESLVWRDAGSLIATIQLVATALRMKSCPVGTLGEPFFSNAFNNNLFSAGGILLGR